jgi:Na+(H+)/acetate symporter ActP
VYLPSALKFYQTLGTSIAMPLVLIGISIAGIVVGFMMRVRSFILVGIVSILMVIGTMIQYAYVDLDQTWVLWVACIVLGFLILTFFAWFERNRDRVLTHLRQFKEWDNRRREETQEKSETESARE